MLPFVSFCVSRCVCLCFSFDRGGGRRRKQEREAGGTRHEEGTHQAGAGGGEGTRHEEGIQQPYLQAYFRQHLQVMIKY